MNHFISFTFFGENIKKKFFFLYYHSKNSPIKLIPFKNNKFRPWRIYSKKWILIRNKRNDKKIYFFIATKFKSYIKEN